MHDKNLLLPLLVAQRAKQHPDRIFIDEVGGPSLTYAEFNDAILRWAEAYRRVGVTAGDRVVTMLPSSAKKYLLRDDAVNGATWDREAAGIEIPK